MPGIPSSKGCQNCKRKKIRCDQSWPSCTPCTRSNLSCQGPSSLVKFVHFGQQDPSAPSTVSSGALTQQPDTQVARLLDRNPVRVVGEGGAAQGVFRLTRPQAPRANLTTVADRVSARLIGLLERGSDGGVRLQMCYLPHLAQRLNRSACLRDCTALFCFAWRQYRRSVPAEELLTTDLYGKAVRSLQRAIHGEDVLSAETLGAMMMLERAVTLFGTGVVQNLSSHHRGIEWVLRNKPPPKMDDEFDVSLAFEAQTIMTLTSIQTDRTYLNESPWKEIISQVADNFLKSDEMKGFPEETTTLNNSLNYLIAAVHEASVIRKRPAEMEGLKNDLVHRSREVDAQLAQIIETTKENAMAFGTMRELDNPHGIVSTKYLFDSVLFAHTLAETMVVRVLILRIIFDMGEVYGEPDQQDYEIYRNACAELWRFAPYIATLDAISATDIFAHILLTIEAADDREKDYILRIGMDADSYQKRLPREKERLISLGVALAKIRTGRQEV